MALSECPHCLNSVEPTSARMCPACGKNVDDASEVRRSRARQQARDEVLEALAAGRAQTVVERELAGRHDAALLRDVFDEIATAHRAKRFEIARAYLWPGYCALLIGAGVSLATALSDSPIIVIARGAIVYGGVSVLWGHWLRRRYR